MNLKPMSLNQNSNQPSTSNDIPEWIDLGAEESTSG